MFVSFLVLLQVGFRWFSGCSIVKPSKNNNLSSYNAKPIVLSVKISSIVAAVGIDYRVYSIDRLSQVWGLCKSFSFLVWASLGPSCFVKPILFVNALGFGMVQHSTWLS